MDIDVRAFFDCVPHYLLLKAVAHHTGERWVLLYISRWLKAPMQMPDGTLMAREKGTPQGSPISPLLANLFMHYAFDTWMDREFPGCPFERYADDIIAHCDSEDQARHLLGRHRRAARDPGPGAASREDEDRVLQGREPPGGLRAHQLRFPRLHLPGPPGQRPKRAIFTGFSPAMSAKAKKAKGQQIRDWHLNRRSGTDLSGLAREINPQVRGWINYYGAFYRSELYFLAWRINEHLARWAMQIQTIARQAAAWARLQKVSVQSTRLFAHWQLIAFTPTDCGGRMSESVHVRS